MHSRKWIIMVAIFLFPLYVEGQTQSKITCVEGLGERKASGADEWVRASKDMGISKGDSLKTGAASYIDVILDPLSSFKIKEKTTIEVATLADESKPPDGSVERLTNINLLQGEIITKLERLPRKTRFTVTGPVAVAGALGTVFSMDIAGDGKTTAVAVMESSATVTSIGEPNKSTTVGKFQKVDIAPWKIARIRATGMGVLSEKILGKEKIDEAVTAIDIESEGFAPLDMSIKDKKKRVDAARKKADLKARSNLYRDICAMKIDPQTNVRDLLLKDESKCERLMKAISEAKVEVSADKAGAKAKVTITLKEVESAIGAKIKSVRMTVKEIPEGEYSKRFKAMARVTTKRAAKVDAYRRLAERIYGTVIDTKTTMEDFAIKDDRITSTVDGIVQGAQELAWRYYSDGSVAVDLDASGANVTADVGKITGDIFGSNYLSAPDVIEVSSFDDLKEIMGK